MIIDFMNVILGTIEIDTFKVNFFFLKINYFFLILVRKIKKLSLNIKGFS